MLPVYVLVGGGSSRFGADKATHPVDGEPWAQHVAGRLAYGGDATLVGTFKNCEPLAGFRMIPDATPGVGPLAGAAAALADRRERLGEGLLVLASCDLVRPEAAWLDSLVAAHEADPHLDAAAYFTEERWQPFPSVLHTRWLPKIAAATRSEKASFQRVFEASRCCAVEWTGGGAGPPQANSLEELASRLGE